MTNHKSYLNYVLQIIVFLSLCLSVGHASEEKNQQRGAPSQLYHETVIDSAENKPMICKTTTIQDVPIELIGEVMTYFRNTKLQRLSLVCKSWWNQAFTAGLWSELIINNPTRSLTIDNWCKISCLPLNYLYMKNNKIQKVDLDHLIKLTDLQKLRLSVYDLHSDMYEQIFKGQYTNLSQLELYDIDIEDTKIDRSIVKFTNLKSLRLLGVSPYSLSAKPMSDTIQSLVACFTSLKSLELSMIEVNDFDLFNIAKSCQELQILNIESHAYITDQGLIPLAQTCMRLQFLSLYSDLSLTTKSCWLTMGQALTALTTLNLPLSNIAQKSFIDLTWDCFPSLKNLNLSYRRGITDDDVQAICRYLTTLTILNLDFTDFTSKSLPFIARLTSLTELNIVKRKEESDDSLNIKNLSSQLINLRKLTTSIPRYLV